MKKINALSNKAGLGTYLSLALGAGAGVGAGALGSHEANAAVVTSNLNETSSNILSGIYFSFNSGVISSGYGSGSYGPGTITGYSGWPAGKGSPRSPFISLDADVDDPGLWSFVSLGPLAYGTTINASTSWGGEQTDTSGGGAVTINQGLTNAYYGVKFYASPGNYNYGWMEISTLGPDLTFGNAVVETTVNTGIGAGVTDVVPEPSTCALLALVGGAGALSLLRRKRAA